MVLIAPSYDGLQVAPGPAPGPVGVPQASPESFGAGVGAALGAVGGSIADVDLQRQQKAAAAKRRVDQASVFDATTQLQKAANESWSGYRQTRGRAAAEKLDGTLAGLNERGAAIESGLTSPEAREVFAANRARFMTDYSARANDHANEQLHAYAATSYDEHIATVTDAAALDAQTGIVRRYGDTWVNRAALDAKLADMDEARESYAEANEDTLGMPRLEWLSMHEKQDRSAFHAGVVSGFLVSQPHAADAWLKEYGASIAQGTREKLQADVTRAVDIEDTRTLATGIFASHAADPGTWAERQDAMLSDAGYARDGIRGDVAQAIKSTIDAAREDESQAKSDALAAFAKLQHDGMPLDRLKQRPGWSDLTAAGQRQLEAEGKEKPDPRVYTDLISAASDPARREAFAKGDLLEQRRYLSKEQYDDLLGIQTAIRKGDDIKELQTTDGIVSDAASVVASRASGEEAKAQSRADFTVKFYDIIRAKRAYALEHGKPWGEEETIALRDTLMGDVVYDRDWLTSNEHVPAWQLDPSMVQVDDIPEPELKQIKDRLSAAGLDANDEALIARSWVAVKQFGLDPP